MRELLPEIVISINQTLVKRTGESHAVLDRGRLESAIGNLHQPYETKEEAYASVFKSLILNHPFKNGNKRTAFVVLFALKKPELPAEEIKDLIIRVASDGGSKITVQEIAIMLYGSVEEINIESINNIIDNGQLGKYLPEYLYHSTFEGTLQAIKERGLGNLKGGVNAPWGTSREDTVGVFLDTDAGSAYAFTETSDDDRMDTEEIIVLRIPTNKINANLLSIDPHNDWNRDIIEEVDSFEDYFSSITYFYEGVIDYKDITLVDEDGSEVLIEQTTRNKNTELTLYRVGELRADVFFTDDLKYYSQSLTGYKAEDVKEYKVNLQGTKIFDPIVKYDMYPETWDSIWTTLEVLDKLGLEDEYEGDEDTKGGAVTSTDALAKAGKRLGYDITVLRDIPGNHGWGDEFTEYVIHNLNVIALTEDINEDLTPEQEQYFKDSKVRDKDGNLIVVYHGTATPGFKEFSPMGRAGVFGEYKFDATNVNYFTSSIETAQGYTEVGVGDVEGDRKNIYACYLNITNPYIVDNKDDRERKTWSGIKDENVRKHEVKVFDEIFNKWKDRATQADIEEINKDLKLFNVGLKPTKDSSSGNDYDLTTLFDNKFWGHQILMYAYTVEEYFSDALYDDMLHGVIGEEYDDYYYTIDYIVRWVLYMNRTQGTNYDGVIVESIFDVGPKGSPFFTPESNVYVTIKSGNQIKVINNEKPTSSNRIDEDTAQVVDSEGNIMTPEQVEFFKNSKARDSDHNLLVLYHGTNTEFKEFDRTFGGASNTKAKIGFWFTPSEDGAKLWAQKSWWGTDRKNPKVVKAYLNITNPKIYETKTSQNDVQLLKNKKEFQLDQAKKVYEKLKSIYYKERGISFEVFDDLFKVIHPYYGKTSNGISTIKGYVEVYGEYIDKSLSDELLEIGNQIEQIDKALSETHYGDSWEQLQTDIYALAGMGAEDANIGGTGKVIDGKYVEEFRDNLIRDGYDGIILLKTRFDTSTFGDDATDNNTQYVVFHSNQIKEISNQAPTNSSRIDEDLTEDDQEVLDKVENYFEEGNMHGSIYILPNGNTIGCLPKDSDEMENFDFDEHQNIEMYLMELGLSEYNRSALGGNASPTLSALGAIRLGDSEYDNNYIELSDKRPTNAQYATLLKWLDENQKHYRKVVVTVLGMKKYKEYDYRTDLSDGIIKKIKRYYTTGTLVEELNTSTTYYRLEVENAFGDNIGGLFSNIWDFVYSGDDQDEETEELESLIDKLMHSHETPNKWYDEAHFAFTDKFYKENKKIIERIKEILVGNDWNLIIKQVSVEDSQVVFRDENQIAYTPTKQEELDELHSSNNNYDSITDSEGNELSDEQVAFFKDSKVRDGLDNLIVVYHGTSTDFSEFDSQDSTEIGFHFGTRQAAEERNPLKVMKCYLNITKPLIAETDVQYWDTLGLMDLLLLREDKINIQPTLTPEEFNFLKDAWNDVGGVDFLDEEELENALDDRGLLKMSWMVEVDGASHYANEDYREEVLNIITSRGYDGIQYINWGEDAGSTSYMAFYPNQIKRIDNVDPTGGNDIDEAKKKNNEKPEHRENNTKNTQSVEEFIISEESMSSQERDWRTEEDIEDNEKWVSMLLETVRKLKPHKDTFKIHIHEEFKSTYKSIFSKKGTLTEVDKIAFWTSFVKWFSADMFKWEYGKIVNGGPIANKAFPQGSWEGRLDNINRIPVRILYLCTPLHKNIIIQSVVLHTGGGDHIGPQLNSMWRVYNDVVLW